MLLAVQSAAPVHRCPRAMAYESYAEFLDALEKAGRADSCQRTDRHRAGNHRAGRPRNEKASGGKALLIEQPTVNGKVSPMPVAINTMGSARRMAMALGSRERRGRGGGAGFARPGQAAHRAARCHGPAWPSAWPAPCTTEEGQAWPVQGSHPPVRPPASRTEPWPSAPDVNDPSTLTPNPSTLLNLPIMQCWPLDGGRFLTLPCVVTRDPDTGDRNLACIGCRFMTTSRPACIGSCKKSPHATAVATTRPASRMPVAVFLGGDPVYPFCATAPMPDGLDEFPARRLPAPQVGGNGAVRDLRPRGAGQCRHRHRGLHRPDRATARRGAVGDHTGYYTLPEPLGVSITAITHRKDATYPPRSSASRRWRIFTWAAPA